MTIMTGREVKSLKSPFCEEDALQDAICPRALSISGSLETRLSNMHARSSRSLTWGNEEEWLVSVFI